MVLMDRVEQRVRSPQHLCGRLMTAEPPERKTETVRSWERGLGGEARSTSAGDLLTASITKSKKKKKNMEYCYQNVSIFAMSFCLSGLCGSLCGLEKSSLTRSKGDPHVAKTVAAC